MKCVCWLQQFYCSSLFCVCVCGPVLCFSNHSFTCSLYRVNWYAHFFSSFWHFASNILCRAGLVDMNSLIYLYHIHVSQPWIIFFLKFTLLYITSTSSFPFLPLLLVPPPPSYHYIFLSFPEENTRTPRISTKHGIKN